MSRSDPALDLAKLFGSLAAIPQGKTGSRVLSEFFEVGEWSTEFFQLAFAISERIDCLEGLIRADVDIEDDLKNDYAAHLHSLRRALSINAFSNDWNWATQQALTADRIAFLKGISPTIRRHAGYTAPSDAEVQKIVEEADKLLGWLEKADLEQYDFLRVAMILGLKELRFRLAKLRFFGHAKASEAFTSLAGVYFALKQASDAEQGPTANRLRTAASRLTKFAQNAYHVLHQGKEVTETVVFWIVIAGIAAGRVGPFDTAIAGLLESPPALLEHKPAHEVQGEIEMNQSDMAAKMEKGDGFIAALDQSGGSTPKALQGYGIEEGGWADDKEMFELIHQMRSRIITAPCFGSGKVIGAILFERTMDGVVAGKPTPQALIDKGIVPFIKIDKGLEEEANGVQLMKPNPGLDDLLRRAKGLGVFGTKERSVINRANPDGIRAAVEQQFEVARQVLAHGLVPIVEPEVNIKSAERDASDRILLQEILKNLDSIPDGERVMLKLSIPAEPGLFEPLIKHPKVLRVVALSGGFSRSDACRELAKNPGMIASFSRALLSDLRHQQSDEEFNATLGSAIDEIYEASTQKVPA